MSEKKVQRLRFTDGEMNTIKHFFCENPDLMKAIRKWMLQMPLDPIDQSIVKDIIMKQCDLQEVIRKAFLPTLDPNAPPHQLVDLWATLEIKDKAIEIAYPLILARQKLVNYLEQQLLAIENEEFAKDFPIKFVDYVKLEGKSDIEMYSDISTRNTMIAHTEMQLQQFAILAGEKEESVEQTKERLLKNSNK